MAQSAETPTGQVGLPHDARKRLSEGDLLSCLSAMTGEQGRRIVYSLEESSHSDTAAERPVQLRRSPRLAEPALPKQGMSESQGSGREGLPSRKTPSNSPQKSVSPNQKSGQLGGVELSQRRGFPKKGSPRKQTPLQKASPRRRKLAGNSPISAGKRKGDRKRQGKKGSGSESEDSDRDYGVNEFIGRMPAQPLDAPSSEGESEESLSPQVPVGIPIPGPEDKIDDDDDAGNSDPDEEGPAAEEQGQGGLHGSERAAGGEGDAGHDVLVQAPRWAHAHIAASDGGGRPDIARRNQLLLHRKGAEDDSESASDWGPDGDTSSDEERAGEQARVPEGGREIEAAPETVPEGLQSQEVAVLEGVGLDEVVPETEEEPVSASEGVGSDEPAGKGGERGAGALGEAPADLPAANGRPVDGAEADSEATQDAIPGDRYGPPRSPAGMPGAGTVPAANGNGHRRSSPAQSSEGTQSDERPQWREVVRAPRGDQLEEPSSGEGGSQSSGKVGRPNGPAEVSGGPTSPACEQVRAQNQGPRGVPLVGPDSTTVDEGAQGPAHLEGEPAVDSPAVLVGDRGAGRRERRVVHELGPGNPIAGARPLGQQVQSGDEEGVSSGGSEEIHGRRGTDRQRFGGAEGVVRGDAQEGGNPGVRRSGQDAALRGVAAASGREGGASEGASAKGGEVRGRLEWSREEEAAPGENSIEKRSSKEDFEDEEESAAEGQGDRSTRVEVPGGAGSQRAEVGAVNGGPTRQNPIAHFGTKEDWTPVPDSEVESERRRAMAAGGPSESEGGSEEVHFGTQKPVVKQEAGSRSSEPESEEKTDSEAQEPQSQGSAPADTAEAQKQNAASDSEESSEESSEEESEDGKDPATRAKAERGTDRLPGATEEWGAEQEEAYQTESEVSSEEESDSGSDSTGREKEPAAAPVKRSEAASRAEGLGAGAEARGGMQRAVGESSSDEEDSSGESEDEAPPPPLAEAQEKVGQQKRRGLPEESSSDEESDDETDSSDEDDNDRPFKRPRLEAALDRTPPGPQALALRVQGSGEVQRVTPASSSSDSGGSGSSEGGSSEGGPEEELAPRLPITEREPVEESGGDSESSSEESSEGSGPVQDHGSGRAGANSDPVEGSERATAGSENSESESRSSGDCSEQNERTAHADSPRRVEHATEEGSDSESESSSSGDSSDRIGGTAPARSVPRTDAAPVGTAEGQAKTEGLETASESSESDMESSEGDLSEPTGAAGVERSVKSAPAASAPAADAEESSEVESESEGGEAPEQTGAVVVRSGLTSGDAAGARQTVASSKEASTSDSEDESSDSEDESSDEEIGLGAEAQRADRAPGAAEQRREPSIESTDSESESSGNGEPGQGKKGAVEDAGQAIERIEDSQGLASEDDSNSSESGESVESDGEVAASRPQRKTETPVSPESSESFEEGSEAPAVGDRVGARSASEVAAPVEPASEHSEGRSGSEGQTQTPAVAEKAVESSSSSDGSGSSSEEDSVKTDGGGQRGVAVEAGTQSSGESSEETSDSEGSAGAGGDLAVAKSGATGLAASGESSDEEDADSESEESAPAAAEARVATDRAPAAIEESSDEESESVSGDSAGATPAAGVNGTGMKGAAAAEESSDEESESDDDDSMDHEQAAGGQNVPAGGKAASGGGSEKRADAGMLSTQSRKSVDLDESSPERTGQESEDDSEEDSEGEFLERSGKPEEGPEGESKEEAEASGSEEESEKESESVSERMGVAAAKKNSLSSDEGSESEESDQEREGVSTRAGKTGRTGRGQTGDVANVAEGGSSSESSDNGSSEDESDRERQPSGKGSESEEANGGESAAARDVQQTLASEDESSDSEDDSESLERGPEIGRANVKQSPKGRDDSSEDGRPRQEPDDEATSESSSEEDESEDESLSDREGEVVATEKQGPQAAGSGGVTGHVAGKKRAREATPDSSSVDTSDSESDGDERIEAKGSGPPGGAETNREKGEVGSQKAPEKASTAGEESDDSEEEAFSSNEDSSDSDSEGPAVKSTGKQNGGAKLSLNGSPGNGVNRRGKTGNGGQNGAAEKGQSTPAKAKGGQTKAPKTADAGQAAATAKPGEFPQVPGEPPLPSFDLLLLEKSLSSDASAEDSFHALLAQLWAANVKDGPALALRIPAVDTAGLARQPIRRFAELTPYVNNFRVWVLLEAWETILGGYEHAKKGTAKPVKAPQSSTLLDVCGVSQPGDGFSYLELASRLDDGSNLPEKDEVVLLEEVRFVDDSQPGFQGAAGHWERGGKTVLAFSHYGLRKGTLKVRGAYRPATKAVCVLRVCSLTTLARSWVALYEMGAKAYYPLILDPQRWAPGAHGATLPPEQRAQHQPRVTDDFFWSRRDGPIWLHFLRTWHEKGLVNDDQVEAMAVGLLPQERLTLIQGPPGTGKTSTIVALVSAILVATPTARILLCAPSNGAVDECTRRLLGGNMIDKEGKRYAPELHHVLRVGPPGQVHPACKMVTMDAQMDTRRGSANYRDMGPRAAEEQMHADMLTCAKVVCATLSGSGMDLVTAKMRPFTVVIVDEAAQAVEPEALIALNRLADGGRMILVGDPCQLPATVIQHPQAPYEVSLFERLQAAGSRCTLLTTQYRMHPAIRTFPSGHFYEGRLQDAASVLARPLVIGDSSNPVCNPRDLLRVYSGDVQFNLSPYRFLDVRWSSEQNGGGGSTQNNLEAAVVAAVVSGLVKALTAGVPVRGADGLIELRRFNPGNTTRGSGPPFSVGVITPYSAQKQLICTRLSRKGVPREAYEVNTVDGFQGREMDAVVLSTVRAARGGHSGPGGTIGFVSDRRRMNVALTRARHCLLIVGDSQTLAARSADWRALIADAKARNCFEAIEKDGKSPRKGGAQSGQGPGGSGDGSGGKRKDGRGGVKRKLEMGDGEGKLAAQGGEKKRRVGGKGIEGVSGAAAANTAEVSGKRDEERQTETGAACTSDSAETSRKKKEKEGKVKEQKQGGLPGKGDGGVAAKPGAEAETQEKTGRKKERTGDGADKLTGKQTAGEDAGPGERKMAKEELKKPKQQAIHSSVGKQAGLGDPAEGEGDKPKNRNAKEIRSEAGSFSAQALESKQGESAKLGEKATAKIEKKRTKKAIEETVGKADKSVPSRGTVKAGAQKAPAAEKEAVPTESLPAHRPGTAKSDTVEKSGRKRKADREGEAADAAGEERAKKRPKFKKEKPGPESSAPQQRRSAKEAADGAAAEGFQEGSPGGGGGSTKGKDGRTTKKRKEKARNGKTHDGKKLENGPTEAADLLADQGEVTPFAAGEKNGGGSAPLEQSARASGGPQGGVTGRGRSQPRPILKRKSSVSKKGWKVGKKVRLAKHVHFQDPKHLVQVRYIPRLTKEAGKAERDRKEGPKKGAGRKGGLTFQTFVDLKKARKRWDGKAAPADGRLLKGGQDSSATKRPEGESRAKAERSAANVAGRVLEQDVLKKRGVGSAIRNGDSAEGTRKGPLPLVAVSGKKH